MIVTMHNILVVSDHRILRQGLRVLLDGRPSLHVVGDVDGSAAFAMARELQPTIILLDLTSPDLDSGLKLVAECRAHLPNARIIVLAPSGAERTSVSQATRAGAVGYILEDDADIQRVEEAIQLVGQGHRYLPHSHPTPLLATVTPKAQGRPSSKRSGLDRLSPRELGVVALVTEGKTNRQISADLLISESTVRTHLHSIFDKLQLTNRVQIVAYALGSQGGASDESSRRAGDHHRRD